MTLPTKVLKEVAGRQITQDDVISRLKLNGAWYGVLAELSGEAQLLQKADQLGLSVSDDELQQEFDDFRRARELEQADDTHKWLNSAGITVEQVESGLEVGILADKLAEKLIDDGQVEAYYNQNPKEFEYARVSHLVVDEEGAAEELALSVREEDEDFAKLARKHSLDKSTGCGGGFLGLMTRQETTGLPQDAADRIFAASQGEVIGPFALPDRGHCLVKVEEVGQRVLDDDLRLALRQQLFGQQMSETAGDGQ